MDRDLKSALQNDIKNHDMRGTESLAAPPETLGQISRQLGPGLIIAAAIVGSGELIATTKTGATAGISLLWLILFGCVVKIFVQLELGRFTISHGETTLTALARVPGPRIGNVNWVIALWGVMMLTTVAQLGGIVGGVGQALAMTVPFTGDMAAAVQIPDTNDVCLFADWNLLDQGRQPKNGLLSKTSLQKMTPAQQAQLHRQMQWIGQDLHRAGSRGDAVLQAALLGDRATVESLNHQDTFDDAAWVVVVGILTTALLLIGRYRLIEKFSLVLVVSFTVLTVINVIALQFTDQYHLSAATLWSGLSFQLPEGNAAIATALAAFGIIGVGATELISYPYWCLEKGYARSVGPRNDSADWLRRAQGWFRVMKYDAFVSMVIYTIATAAFYIMGVAVLHSEVRDPAGMRMVSTLAQSYVPIFGRAARWLFLGGAIAVLYSTYLVACASNARMMADFFGVLGFRSRDPESAQRKKDVVLHSAIWPLACVVVFLFVKSPVKLVLLSGVTQMLMLPVIGVSTLFFDTVKQISACVPVKYGTRYYCFLV